MPLVKLYFSHTYQVVSDIQNYYNHNYSVIIIADSNYVKTGFYSSVTHYTALEVFTTFDPNSVFTIG